MMTKLLGLSSKRMAAEVISEKKRGVIALPSAEDDHPRSELELIYKGK